LTKVELAVRNLQRREEGIRKGRKRVRSEIMRDLDGETQEEGEEEGGGGG